MWSRSSSSNASGAATRHPDNQDDDFDFESITHPTEPATRSQLVEASVDERTLAAADLDHVVEDDYVPLSNENFAIVRGAMSMLGAISQPKRKVAPQATLEGEGATKKVAIEAQSEAKGSMAFVKAPTTKKKTVSKPPAAAEAGSSSGAMKQPVVATRKGTQPPVSMVGGLGRETGAPPLPSTAPGYVPGASPSGRPLVSSMLQPFSLSPTPTLVPGSSIGPGVLAGELQVTESDTCLDPEVARMLNVASILDRDLRAANQIEIPVAMAYVAAREAECRAIRESVESRLLLQASYQGEYKEMRLAYNRALNEVSQKEELVKQEKKKNSTLRGGLKKEKKKAEGLQKTISDKTSAVSVAEKKAADAEARAKAAEEKAQKAQEELNTAVEAITTLTNQQDQIRQEANEEAIREFLASEDMFNKIATTLIPMRKHFITETLSKAMQLAPNVDWESSELMEDFEPKAAAEFEKRVNELREGVDITAKYADADAEGRDNEVPPPPLPTPQTETGDGQEKPTPLTEAGGTQKDLPPTAETREGQKELQSPPIVA